MNLPSVRTPPADDPDCLVLGGSGAVGRFLLRRLSNAGQSVIALSRAPAPRWAQGWSSTRWQQGGLPHTRLIELPATTLLLSAGPLDALAAACQAGLPSGVRRVVALSSMSIDWKRDSPNPAERDLAQRLTHAERQARESLNRAGIELVILRPGMIYGAGIDRSLSPLLHFARRWRFLPWPSAGIGLRCPVHADDIAAALHRAAFASSVPAHPLRLVGADSLPFDQLLDQLLSRLSVKAARVPIPVPISAFRAFAARGGSVAAGAATLFRCAHDQHVDTRDWQQLGLLPRRFEPKLEDFVQWPS